MDMPRTEWLARRRKYIGGSDAAGALGMSEWNTPLKVCQSKWSESDDTPSKAMLRGKTLEQLVLNVYTRMTEHVVHPETWVVSDEHYWMAATPDGHVFTIDSSLQIKTSSHYYRDGYGKPGSSDIPSDYTIQVQHEMAVTGAKRTIVYVLFAEESVFDMLCRMVKEKLPMAFIVDCVVEMHADESNPLEVVGFLVERDDALIASIITGERHFWETYALPHVSPPDASVPEKIHKLVPATDEQLPDLQVLRERYIARNLWTKRYDRMAEKVQGMIGHHEGIYHDDVGPIRYKAPAPKPVVDWQAVATEGIEADRLAELVEQHTTTKQDKRKFTVPRWK